MGENEKVLVLPTPPPYLPSLKAVCDEIKEELMRELGGKPHKVPYKLPNCKVSYKDGQIVVDELTKLPMGITATNMSQDDLKQSGFPILFVKGYPRKPKRKHYKPKFTL